MNYIISFGIPLLVLVLMLTPFFLFRKKENWVGDWQGAIARWVIGIGIWSISIWLFYSNFYYSNFTKFDTVSAHLAITILLYFLIWPFFGFNLFRGTRLTKNLIFQLFIGLLNLAIGVVLLIFGTLWGVSHIMY